jgi:two-component system response regulator FixJ
MRTRAAPQPKLASRARSPDDPATVILVEDDFHLRRALGRLLRVGGYSVTSFGLPSKALLSQFPTSNACLVLDIYMPEMTGVELWHALNARGCRLPTILITGHQDEQALLYGKQIGAVAVLFKPIEGRELFETIERALAQGKR